MAQIRIGFSGWTFPGWRGNFYPKGVSQKRELEYASRQVNSIEINGTFYAIQKPHSFQAWYEQTPEDFRFAVKANMFITHERRLKDVEAPLANFLGSGLFKLKEKLGPLLWQFPPNMMLKDDRFERFLKILPRDTETACEFSRSRMSDWMKSRCWTDLEEKYRLRHAFEFRHPSFMNADFLSMLREYGVAVVFAHAGKKSPYTEDLTADFVYARMHGEDKRFAKGYDPKFIDAWAKRVKTWVGGKSPKDAPCVLDTKPKLVKRDVFIYFDTEAKKYAPQDARKLMEKLGVEATGEFIGKAA